MKDFRQRCRRRRALFSRSSAAASLPEISSSLFVVWMGGEAGMSFVLNALMQTSAVMLVVGLLACVEPARRALTIDLTTALRDG